MRRFLTSILCAALCIGLLCACGKKSDSSVEAAPTVLETGLCLSQTQAVTSQAYMSSSDFSSFITIAEPAFIIPGLNEAMIPQGMSYCESNGLIYISGYYSAGSASVIAVLDGESFQLVAEYFLYNADMSPFSSHVGGVAVTDKSLFVSSKMDNDGSYCIARLSLSDLPTTGSHDIIIAENITVPVSPSFLSYSGGYIWVGNFYYPKAGYDLSSGMDYTTSTADGDYGCYILAYDEAGGFSSPRFILAAPDRIQGFALLDDNTAVLSQSYGRKNNSTLYRYDLDLSSAPDTWLTLENQSIPAFILDSGRLLSATTAMPMSEALSPAPDGTLLVLFESGAMHYSDGKFRTDYVWKVEY